MGAWGYSVFDNDSIMDVVGHTVEHFFTNEEFKELVAKIQLKCPNESYCEGIIQDAFMVNRHYSENKKNLINMVYHFVHLLGEKEIQNRLDLLTYNYDPDLYLLGIFKVSMKTQLHMQATVLEMADYLYAIQYDFSNAESYNKVEQRKNELVEFHQVIISSHSFNKEEIEQILSLVNDKIKNRKNSKYFGEDKNTLMDLFKIHGEKLIIDNSVKKTNNNLDNKKLKI